MFGTGKRPALRAVLFLFIICISFVSCAKSSSETKKKQRLPLPADEASSEERAQLDATLTQIEQITSDLGKPRSFRDVPLILTTDDRTYTDHPAGCVTVEGDAQFILVKRTVLENEAQLSPSGVESTLFRVLLHEIGHCYYNRVHEENVQISDTGRVIELSIKREGHVSAVDFSMLDATVMVPENLSVPVALEKYYVAEILGLARAKTLEDLAAYAPLKYVKEPTQ